MAFRAGDLAEARTRFTRAYELSSTIGYRRGQAHNLLALGKVARDTAEPTTARGFFTDALAIYEELGLALAEEARAELATLGADDQ